MATEDQKDGFDGILQQDEETLYHVFYSAMKLKAREKAYESYKNFITAANKFRHSNRPKGYKEETITAMNQMDKWYHIAQDEFINLDKLDEGMPSDIDILKYNSQLTSSNGETLGPEEYFKTREEIEKIAEKFQTGFE